jgi:tetratricopeptide (TPR) repeat protein
MVGAGVSPAKARGRREACPKKQLRIQRMKTDLRVWLKLIGVASLVLASGCAGTQERGSQPWLSLPSPWSSVKNSPARGSAIGEEKPVAAAKSRTPAKSTAKTKDKQNKDEESAAMALLRGVNHERSGEWDKARQIYEDIRQKQPGNMDAVHRLAIVADAQRRHAEAEQLFLLALQNDPRNPELLADLGYCYFLQGHLAKAESALRKATTLEPSNQRYCNNLGLVVGHLGRHEEALECFRKASSEADAQYNLAFVYAAQERPMEAKTCFQLALGSDPTHRRAREALSSFEEYDRLPKYLRDINEVADTGVKYVPYIEGSDSSNVATAGGQANMTTSYNASRVARALHTESRGMLNRNMASQRADEVSAQ